MSKIEVNAIEPQCGTTLTIGASDTSIAGIGTVNWDTTAKTAAFTAVSGRGYFVNTTSGAITVTLPAGSAGAIVAFADYANTFDTNNLTISPNGTDKIGGTNSDAPVSTEGASTTFIYVDSTQGWKQVNDATLNTVGQTFITATGGTVTTCGNFKIHTFTSPGTFCVSAAASSPDLNTVSYLVVAGGGGATGMGPSNSNGGGGGGAGGYRENKGPEDSYTASPIEGSTDIVVTATAFPITVGAGGAGVGTTASNNGSNSVFSTITSAGGGGSSGPAGGTPSTGGNGGSGGGGSANCGVGGTGNTPPVSPSQGNPGGFGYAANPASPNCGSPQYGGGAGGGATGAGGGGVPSGVCSGVNGAGATTSISGSSTLYAEGGGGANYCRPNDPGHSQGSGGNSGYGPYPGPNNAGENGTTNTGGGGGGGSNAGGTPAVVNGGSGGSGIVIIRYKFQ